MIQAFPFKYYAYGLMIASEIPVIGFKEVDEIVPDVMIIEGNVPEHIENVISQSSFYQSNDHEFLFRRESMGIFYVTNGNQIVIQKSESIKDAELSSVIIGICLGAILHQRKLLPLHASAIFFKNKCIVIAGKSGAGKTTLAAAFLKAGALLIADDVSLIKFSNEVPEIVPAFPTIKICPDSLLHLGQSSMGLLPVRDEMQKFYLPVDQFQNNPTPIDLVIILNTHNFPVIEFHDVTGYQKFLELKKYTYLHKSFSKNDYIVNHFTLVSKLASKVPVYKLLRSKTNFNLDQLIKSISMNIGV